MQLLEGEELVLSPTDLTGFAACKHLTQLDLEVVYGKRERPHRDDPELDLLSQKGGQHEADLLERYEAEGEVVKIADHGSSRAGLEAAEAETLAAMRAGAEVIYQATFFDGTWVGYADFVFIVDTPSDLGAWSYEVGDAKLSKRVKGAALLQMCGYSEQVERLQGAAPEWMHVLTGDKAQHPFRVADYAAYYRSLRDRYLEFVRGADIVVYPEPVDHCGVCRWEPTCDERRHDDDHLSLVAGLRRDQTRKLVAVGINTMASLARSPSNTEVAGINHDTLKRLRTQAELQVDGADCNPPKHVLLEPLAADELGKDRGLAGLPPPSWGDLFFDMEGDPWAGDGGLEYLFGVIDGAGGTPEYRAFWGHNQAEEQRAFEDFIDFVTARLAQDPEAHIYHYAAYETVAVKKLMGKYATREEEVNRLLRGGAFVDLYRVVVQSVQISTEGYGLKKIEALYDMQRAPGELTDGASSIVAYENYLESSDTAQRRQILDDIAEYNEADCESTRLLRAWLEARRPEVEHEFGEVPPRPEERDPEPSDDVAERAARVLALEGRLCDGIGEDEPLTNEQTTRRLLAHLLSWHRREALPEYWAYFRRLYDLSGDELVDDSECIGGLEYLGSDEPGKYVTIHHYKFAPQDHKFGIGSTPVDPATEKGAGTVVGLDDALGTIDLSRRKNSAAPHPKNLIASKPVNTNALAASIAAVADWVAEHGIEGPGPYRAARDLLLRTPRIEAAVPSNSGDGKGEDLLETAVRAATQLDDTCLAVQGPPGSGKTYTGAHMIVELVRQGRRVGVTANSHAVIGTLLKEVWKVAERKGLLLHAIQKCNPELGQHCGIDEVASIKDNAEVIRQLDGGEANLVAGTAWLFSDDGMADKLDVLFVDEAGQMSLANAVAVSRAARSMVLLGDPRQLAQPGKGTHPEGAGVSALEHLLGEHKTMPAHLGLFLDTTHRMHPDVCRYVSEVSYERRLHSEPDLDLQCIDGAGEPLLNGSGLRFVCVEHPDDRSSSTAEACRVAQLVDGLEDATWTDKHGNKAKLGLDEVLIVTPYNAQVACLREHLPAGAQIGTVDKFQGKQAAVAVYTMATSSADDVSRTIEFLYDLHRLNVAVSRARALSVIVCSPDLLRLHCRTAEQMPMVNALCRYAECAT